MNNKNKMSVASVMKPLMREKKAGMPMAEAKASMSKVKPVMKKGKAKGMSKKTLKVKVSRKKM